MNFIMSLAVYVLTVLLLMGTLGDIIDLAQTGFTWKKFTSFILIAFITAVFVIISVTGEFSLNY